MTSQTTGDDQNFDQAQAFQELIATRDRATYNQKLQEIAAKLGCSVRAVQRQVRSFKQQGLAAPLSNNARSDRGKHRIDQFWVDLIQHEWRKCNQGYTKASIAQIANRVRAEAVELGRDDYPSYSTICRILNSYKKETKKAKLSLNRVKHSQEVTYSTHTTRLSMSSNLSNNTLNNREATHSNEVWLCDIAHVGVLLVDHFGQSVGRPWLISLIDAHSGCVAGFNLSLHRFGFFDLLLTLRHAILPKSYEEYQLNTPWEVYGLPEILITDGERDFTSTTVKQVTNQLGIKHVFRSVTSDGWLTERFLGTLDHELFMLLPGYISSASEASEAASVACLTLRDLERLLMRYMAHTYNQSPYPRLPEITRSQRWLGGLNSTSTIPSTQELDICLPKTGQRTVHAGGHFKFSHLTYRSEYLTAHAGETISLRYLPTDISSVAVYQQRGHEEIFIGYAACLEAESQPISVWEAVSRQRHQRRNQDKT
jgi:putative transposase